MLGQVEPFQQSTEFNCSAASLHAVLKHWGRDIDESALAQLLHVSPVFGATAKRVVKVARGLGYKATQRHFRSLAELKSLTDKDVPVIARVLSFKHPGQHHFVVVTSVDAVGVTLMDPNVDGNRRWLTHQQMKERWVPNRLGVVITPTSTAFGEVSPSGYVWTWLGAAAVAVVGVVAGWYYGSHLEVVSDHKRSRRGRSN